MLGLLRQNNLDIRFKNRISPEIVWRGYSQRCQAVGMKSSALILSFDCDTDEDIEVAWAVHTQLMDMGILSAYAVPGAQLEHGADVYRRIAATGAEFLNHGGRAHTYFDESKQAHRSCFFYEQQSLQDLEADIRLGHEVVTSVIGTAPRGWRTPHFGSFQGADHAAFLYPLLTNMGYLYSSSGMPEVAMRNGPFRTINGIHEIALTGIYNSPLSNMDSWGHFVAEGCLGGDAYVTSCRQLAMFAERHPVLINIYADPSHIADEQGFFAGLHDLIQAAKPTTFHSFIQDLT